MVAEAGRMLHVSSFPHIDTHIDRKITFFRGFEYKCVNLLGVFILSIYATVHRTHAQADIIASV